MAVIPTVPGYVQAPTPQATVKADFSQLDRPNRARAAAAQTVGAVGQELGNIALKIQEGVNYGLAAEADRQMRATAAEFQQGLVGRTDEDQWESQWREKAQEVWGSLAENNQIGPALKRQLTQTFRDWEQANTIEVKMLANRQRVNRALARVELDADEAARDGDETGVVTALEGAVQSGLMLPEQGKKLQGQYLTKIDEYAARTYIMNDPAGAVDFIEAKDEAGKPANLKRLTPDQRQTLANTARVAFTKYQTENLQEMIEGLQRGEVMTPQELQGLVEQKVISAKQRRSYEAAYRHGNYNTNVEAIAGLFGELTNYDPQKDPQFTERAKLMARISTSGFPQNVQSEMNQLLGQKTDVKNVLNSPVAKDAFAAIDQRFNYGMYGKFRSTVIDDEGRPKTVINTRAYEAAIAKKSRIEDATRRFLNQNPAATAEEVNRFVSDIQVKEVVNSGRAPVLQFLELEDDDREARLDAILKKDKD